MSVSSSIKLPGPLTADRLISPDAVTVPVNVGVAIVGLVPNTNAPLPVSSEITPASSAEVVAAKTDSLSAVFANVADVGIVVELIVKPLTFVTVAPEPIDVEPRVGAEYPVTVPHWTPVPVDCKYCPLVPDDEPAVRVPVSVPLSNVRALIVDIVVPEVTTVVPRVGAV